MIISTPSCLPPRRILRSTDRADMKFFLDRRKNAGRVIEFFDKSESGCNGRSIWVSCSIPHENRKTLMRRARYFIKIYRCLFENFSRAVLMTVGSGSMPVQCLTRSTRLTSMPKPSITLHPLARILDKVGRRWVGYDIGHHQVGCESVKIKIEAGINIRK